MIVQYAGFDDGGHRAGIEAEAKFELSPQDAVVFASIDRYFSQRPQVTKLFANKNRHDFFGLDLRTHLQQYGCKLLPGFANTLRFLESRLGWEVWEDTG